MRAIRANHLKPAIRNFQPPEARFAKKGAQFGNPEAIRENQAIRANLRIDSCESGHLNMEDFQLPLHSWSVSSRIGVVPARKKFGLFKGYSVCLGNVGAYLRFVCFRGWKLTQGLYNWWNSNAQTRT